MSLTERATSTDGGACTSQVRPIAGAISMIFWSVSDLPPRWIARLDALHGSHCSLYCDSTFFGEAIVDRIGVGHLFSGPLARLYLRNNVNMNFLEDKNLHRTIYTWSSVQQL